MIVIHIGLRKSGSTSIQRFLSANEEALRTMGIDYPPIARATRPSHRNLAYEIRGHPDFNPRHGALSQIADHRRDSAAEVMVLSSENFEACGVSDASRLKAILGREGDNFRIVLIIRDLISLAPSTYSQNIRNGKNIFDFDTFFERRMRKGGVEFFYTAKAWAEAFGWENLRVRVLDPRYLANGDLIDEFLTLLGLDLDQDKMRRLERPGIPNASPGWRVQEAVRRLYGGRHALDGEHTLGAPTQHGKEQRKIVGYFAREVGERWGWNADLGRYLTRPQAQRCLEVYAGAVEMLNQNVGEPVPPPLELDARGFIEREFLPDASLISPRDLQSFYDETAAFADCHLAP